MWNNNNNQQPGYGAPPPPYVFRQCLALDLVANLLGIQDSLPITYQGNCMIVLGFKWFLNGTNVSGPNYQNQQPGYQAGYAPSYAPPPGAPGQYVPKCY